ncbi:MAG: hypothetical protein QGF89_00700 [Candidatus Marinimicrobia bacterium]|jgi:hypothetical protein|nr:hypothetical protein [Candidatus Neomarinimicrobiota bacterium]
MNENIKVGVGFLIPAAALITFFVSILFEQFLLGILIAIAGIFAWFLYTAVMETGMPTVAGNIIIVFGVLVSLAAFLNYGIEQNMFGGFSVNLEGLSGSAILLFFSVLLGVLFRNKPLTVARSPVATQPASPLISPVEKELLDDGEEDDGGYDYPDYEDYEAFYSDYFDDDSPYEYDEEE